MPPRSATRASIGLLLAALCLGAGEARAEPQGTAGITLGLAGAGLDHQVWDKTLFHLGVRGDILFGREKGTDFGIGPYAEILTHGFDQIQLGAGVSGLLPVIDPFPIVLSVGVYGRRGDDPFGFEPGVTGQLFWGSRSYNFHGSYVMAVGFLGEARIGLGPSKETSFVLSAQLDVVALSLPVVFLASVIRGGSSEVAPVR
ncbi:MAG: hypothetical protein ABI193_05875 [Minicystis sp.]